jgi:hypothetical protein
MKNKLIPCEASSPSTCPSFPDADSRDRLGANILGCEFWRSSIVLNPNDFVSSMVEARGAVLGLTGTSMVCLRFADRFALGFTSVGGDKELLRSCHSFAFCNSSLAGIAGLFALTAAGLFTTAAADWRLGAGLFAPAAADWRLGAGLFDLAAWRCSCHCFARSCCSCTEGSSPLLLTFFSLSFGASPTLFLLLTAFGGICVAQLLRHGRKVDKLFPPHFNNNDKSEDILFWVGDFQL